MDRLRGDHVARGEVEFLQRVVRVRLLRAQRECVQREIRDVVQEGDVQPAQLGQRGCQLDEGVVRDESAGFQDQVVDVGAVDDGEAEEVVADGGVAEVEPLQGTVVGLLDGAIQGDVVFHLTALRKIQLEEGGTVGDDGVEGCDGEIGEGEIETFEVGAILREVRDEGIRDGATGKVDLAKFF